MPTYLEGVAVQFYRGIGPETQYIAPFSEMNFFVGANNAGKSVVLNLIRERLPQLRKGHVRIQATAQELDRSETYRGKTEGSPRFLLGVSEAAFSEHLFSVYNSRLKQSMRLNEILDKKLRSHLQTSLERVAHFSTIWVDVDGTQPSFLADAHPELMDASEAAGLELLQLACRVFGLVQPINCESALKQIFHSVSQLLTFNFPERLLIPAKRELGAGDDTFDDLSGKGLIRHLAEMQNPDHHEREKKELFDQINDFVRVVTGKPDAQLEVPNHRQHLLVHMDNKVLPLSSLGTGIHEVILIAAFCTIHQQRIMCIEEPEIHLHPVLQRKLIRYLQDKTENQYFIATHSAAFIDTPGASVFHVRNDGVQTYVTPAIVKGDKRRICDDLGYRASDILQANAVIWVEGPSDRIYIRRWLEAVDDKLVEGVHYTIMFYGGGLIKHLSADDDALAEFIKLRDLNRNIAVVMDSDRPSPRAKLKPAAQRIKDEMSKDGGVVWITKGREIENYVPHDRLQAALKQLHRRVYGAAMESGLYEHAFYFHRKGAKPPQDKIYRDADKVGAAGIVCQDDIDLGVLDLKERVQDLVQMIRRANHTGEVD